MPPLLAGDIDRAQDALRDYFEQTRTLDTRPEADAFMAVAAVAASRDEDRFAARLAGLATTDEPALDAVLTEAVRTRFLRPAHDRCGQRAWSAATRDGASLTLAEGVDEAFAFLDRNTLPPMLDSQSRDRRPRLVSDTGGQGRSAPVPRRLV